MPQGASGEDPRRPLKKERRFLSPSPASTVQKEELELGAAEAEVGVEEARSVVIVVVAVSIAATVQRRLLMPNFPFSFST